MKMIHTGLILIATLWCLPSAELIAGGGFKGGGGRGEEARVVVGPCQRLARDLARQI